MAGSQHPCHAAWYELHRMHFHLQSLAQNLCAAQVRIFGRKGLCSRMFNIHLSDSEQSLTETFPALVSQHWQCWRCAWLIHEMSRSGSHTDPGP